MARPPLQNGLILVTGASSGIGRELARQLAPVARGLVLVARREERLRELRDELVAVHPRLRVVVQPCDLTEGAAIEAMVNAVLEQEGAPDVLINNAGFGDIHLFRGARWDKLQRMLRLNIEALTYLTHRLVPPMLQRGTGGILNISSSLGLVAVPGFAVYGGTKHYVTAMSDALRAELAGTGVVVTQICPGPVETEFLERSEGPEGLRSPAIIEISAQRCARASLRAFRRGRAGPVVPGIAIKLLMLLGRVTPRPLMRWLGGFFARTLPP